MAGIGIDIIGMAELKAVFEKKGKALTEALDKEMSATALTIQGKAKRYTPVDNGFLRAAMSVDTTKELFKTVSNTKEYAPYVEFGTGTLVDVPAGLESYAMQFKGKGIRKVNLPARPFLFRAYFEEKPKLIERLKKLFGK